MHRTPDETPDERLADPRHPHGRPTPPEWLGDEAVEHFERACDGLEALGKLTLLDRNVIARYAATLCQWERLQVIKQQAEANGSWIITTKDGQPWKLHPVYSTIALYDRMLVRCERDLFMAPAYRERIKVPRQSKRRLKVVSYEGATGGGNDAG